jgi:hypothetical protein
MVMARGLSVNELVGLPWSFVLELVVARCVLNIFHANGGDKPRRSELLTKDGSPLTFLAAIP